MSCSETQFQPRPIKPCAGTYELVGTFCVTQEACPVWGASKTTRDQSAGPLFFSDLGNIPNLTFPQYLDLQPVRGSAVKPARPPRPSWSCSSYHEILWSLRRAGSSPCKTTAKQCVLFPRVQLYRQDAMVPGFVDVHHHSFPPAYAEFLASLDRPAGGWPPSPWSEDIDAHFCANSNISVAMLSCIPGGPSVKHSPDQAKGFTRSCNEWNAALCDRHPKHYGFFAGISNMAFPEIALEEIRHAFDDLGADGITLATRYTKENTSYYLGHESLIPVWDELNRRKAVAFIHPVPSADPTVVNENLPPPTYDFPHETGRTTMDLIVGPANMLEDHANDCKIILSHAGGDLPYLIDRAAGLLSGGPTGVQSVGQRKSKAAILNRARRFYYDTALSSSAMNIAALTALLGPEGARDRLLFGTDFPPGGVDAIAEFTRQLGVNFDVDTLRGNASKLFPRLQQG